MKMDLSVLNTMITILNGEETMGQEYSKNHEQMMDLIRFIEQRDWEDDVQFQVNLCDVIELCEHMKTGNVKIFGIYEKRLQQREQSKQKIIQLMRQAFKDDPTIGYIWVRGSTPEWNDGEECEHSQQTSVGFAIDGQIKDSFEDSRSYREHVPSCTPAQQIDWSKLYKIEPDFDGETWQERRDQGIAWRAKYQHPVPENHEKARNLFQSWEQSFNDVFGTNFDLFATMQNGELVIETETYDLGY